MRLTVSNIEKLKYGIFNHYLRDAVKEKISTLHPTKGKTGRNIDGKKYVFMKKAILRELRRGRENFKAR